MDNILEKQMRKGRREREKLERKGTAVTDLLAVVNI